MEKNATLRQHANKIDGLLYDLNRVMDVMEDICNADEDSPWELLYLRDETDTMVRLAGKRDSIVNFIVLETKSMTELLEDKG